MGKRVLVHKLVRLEKSFSKEPDYTGKFLLWGVDYQEYDEGPGQFTVGVVQKDDGSICMPRADLIKFLT